MKIAIVGAGPGGLTLANILQQKGIECTVFEADESASSRNQGGTLDLHKSTGQLALKEAGLLKEFEKYARPEGDMTKITRHDGAILRDENIGASAKDLSLDNVERPEIEREHLRKILLEGLGKEKVMWGRKVDKILQKKSESEPAAINELHFKDGQVEEFDLIVGADGAWSKVRNILSTVKPEYSSITMVEMWAFNVSEDHAQLAEYTGNGTNFMFGDNRCVISQRCGDDAIRLYACLRVEEDWHSVGSGIDWQDEIAARETLTSVYFKGFGENIKQAIVDCSDNLVIRPLYMLPIGFKYDHVAGVTLLGDSAHLMTPFAGEGVNLAMKDAYELANAIASAVASTGSNSTSKQQILALDREIVKYERELFRRGKYYTTDTYNNMQLCFSKDGSEKFSIMMAGGVLVLLKMGLEYLRMIFWSFLGY